jgi:hypothetical protein
MMISKGFSFPEKPFKIVILPVSSLVRDSSKDPVFITNYTKDCRGSLKF